MPAIPTQGMEAERPWEDLPADLVGEIAGHLACPVDRFRMSTVCPAWGAALLQPPRRRHIPCLLLPYCIATEGQEAREESIGCITCGVVHRVRFPERTRKARFIGAYEGSWVFIAAELTKGHELVNLSTGEEPILLPDKMLVELGAQSWLEDIIILAVTLSARPLPLQGCVAAAVVRSTDFLYDYITFWRMGSHVGCCSRKLVEDRVEDVIYYHGAFCFLTAQKNLLICTCSPAEGALEDELNVQVEELRFQPVVDKDEKCPYFPEFVDRGRYLVECRGELLMVLRILPSELPGPTYPVPGSRRELTSSFRVFRMTKADATKDGQAEYVWDELNALDGRLLFIAQGCSRSFQGTDGSASNDAIYFHDESYRWTWMLWNRNRKFGCKDNGMCLVLPDNIRRLYPGLGPSTYSSPMWCL